MPAPFRRDTKQSIMLHDYSNLKKAIGLNWPDPFHRAGPAVPARSQMDGLRASRHARWNSCPNQQLRSCGFFPCFHWDKCLGGRRSLGTGHAETNSLLRTHLSPCSVAWIGFLALQKQIQLGVSCFGGLAPKKWGFFFGSSLPSEKRQTHLSPGVSLHNVYTCLASFEQIRGTQSIARHVVVHEGGTARPGSISCERALFGVSAGLVSCAAMSMKQEHNAGLALVSKLATAGEAPSAAVG